MDGRSSSNLSKTLGGEGISAIDCSEDDFVKKSDVGSSHVRVDDKNDVFGLDYDSGDDHDRCVDEILYDETVKKKLEVLAMMVGADSSQPEGVLTQVVKVLKDLERERIEYLKREEDFKANK